MGSAPPLRIFSIILVEKCLVALRCFALQKTDQENSSVILAYSILTLP